MQHKLWLAAMIALPVFVILTDKALTIQSTRHLDWLACTDPKTRQSFQHQIERRESYVEAARTLKRQQAAVNLRGLGGIVAEMEAQYSARLHPRYLTQSLCESQTARIQAGEPLGQLEIGYPSLTIALQERGISKLEAERLAFCAVMNDVLLSSDLRQLDGDPAVC